MHQTQVGPVHVWQHPAIKATCVAEINPTLWFWARLAQIYGLTNANYAQITASLPILLSPNFCLAAVAAWSS